MQLLRERGLKRIKLATTDGRTGLEQAIRAAFPGSIWCRCHAYFTRNVLEKTPAAYKKRMHQLLGRMLEAHSPQEAREVFDAAYEEIAEQAPKALAVLEAGLEDAIAVLALPAKYRRRLRTTNMLERLIEELRRREKVIRIFHRRISCARSRPGVLWERSWLSIMRSGAQAGSTSGWRSTSSGEPRSMTPRSTKPNRTTPNRQ